MSKWKSLDNESLPELLLKTKKIARQARSKDEAEIISTIAESSAITTTSIAATYTSTTYYTKASLNYLWAALNSQQVVVQLPLMKDIKFPASTMEFNKFLVKITSFNLFSTDEIDEYLYYLPDKESFNTNFEMCDIEDRLFTTNIGFVFWITAFNLLVALLSLCFYKFKGIW